MRHGEHHVAILTVLTLEDRENPSIETCRIKRLRDISNEVLDIFTARTESNEAFGNSVTTPSRPTLRGRMKTAKACCLTDEAAGGKKSLGILPVSQDKTDDRAKPLHLTDGDGASRIVR